jgi:hypothetical protein
MVQAGQIGSLHELGKDVSKWRSHLSSGSPKVLAPASKMWQRPSFSCYSMFLECDHFTRIEVLRHTYIVTSMRL